MLIDQIEDDTYAVFLDESDKNALFAAAQHKNVPPAELLEEVLLTCLHFICEKGRQLPEPVPLSPGMPGFVAPSAERIVDPDLQAEITMHVKTLLGDSSASPTIENPDSSRKDGDRDGDESAQGN